MGVACHRSCPVGANFEMENFPYELLIPLLGVQMASVDLSFESLSHWFVESGIFYDLADLVGERIGCKIHMVSIASQLLRSFLVQQPKYIFIQLWLTRTLLVLLPFLLIFVYYSS